MNEVTPWIRDHFLNLATTHGSDYNTVPPTAQSRKCQLKKVLTFEPKEYFWIVLSDQQYEVPGRIPKDVVEQCLGNTGRGQKFTRNTGSVISIREFSPLLALVEDEPSTSALRETLILDIKRIKILGGTGERIWGSPKPLESVEDLRVWVHELQKQNGNQNILKTRKLQDEEKAAKQFTDHQEPAFDRGIRLKQATDSSAPVQQRAASAASIAAERSPMQRYRRKWKKAVPGLDEFVRRLQIPEEVRTKILEKLKREQDKPPPSGTIPTIRPPHARGALEIGSSPARLSSVPRATTPVEWPTSPGALKRLYNDHETEMSSDVYSSRLSSPAGVHDDVGAVVPLELKIVPETPQVPQDSQSQRLLPPPPAQPPQPRSPLPSSSNPQMQNSSSSIHTSVQAVSGSQFPSSEKPPVWAHLDDESSDGPKFLLPYTQHDDAPAVELKSTPGPHPSPEEQVTKPPTRVAEPSVPEPSKKKETKLPRSLEESLTQAIKEAFPQDTPLEAATTTHDTLGASPAPRAAVPVLPSLQPLSKQSSTVIQKSFPGPPLSPLGRPTETEDLESPVRQPFQALNRKVPAPKVGPTWESIRGRNENGIVAMVLVPASDEIKPPSQSKQNSSSQPVQSSQYIPSSLPALSSPAHLPPSRLVPSSGPQVLQFVSQQDQSAAQEDDSIAVHVNESVANLENLQDIIGVTQSSLEYASTQDDDKVGTNSNPQARTDNPTGTSVTTEKVVGEPVESPLPQIATIREVESPQSIAEEVDELEGDSDGTGNPPVSKRKSNPTKPPRKATKRLQPNGQGKPKPTSNSVVEKAPSRLPPSPLPGPIVVAEHKPTPPPFKGQGTSTPRKRRPASPSEEGFPAPQPLKRSKIHGYLPPPQAALVPVPNTPSPPPQGRRSPVAPDPPQSAKGKGRAEGIRGLENIGTSESVSRDNLGGIQVQAEKSPGTGPKRKPSDAFSVQNDSRIVKRPKVVPEPKVRKPVKQLSFVDPHMLRQPFRTKPQVRKVPFPQVATATPDPSAAVEPEENGRTSKYFNPQIYRKPSYPRISSTTEEQPKAVSSKETLDENDRPPENAQQRIDPRKASTSHSERQLETNRKTPRTLDAGESSGRLAAHARIQLSRSTDDAERDFVLTESHHPPGRKLGSFAPDLNPPPLFGLPGGRLMNKQLREILIRTGKVRTREAKATESK